MTSLPQVAPRIAKLTALSIGVALLATACGGTSTPTSTGSGTASANAAGERGIALLGDPEYYSRFGFVTSTSLGVQAPDPAWGGHFQLLPLAVWPGGVSGTFRYAKPFGTA